MNMFEADLCYLVRPGHKQSKQKEMKLTYKISALETYIQSISSWEVGARKLLAWATEQVQVQHKLHGRDAVR